MPKYFKRNIYNRKKIALLQDLDEDIIMKVLFEFAESGEIETNEIKNELKSIKKSLMN